MCSVLTEPIIYHVFSRVVTSVSDGEMAMNDNRVVEIEQHTKEVRCVTHSGIYLVEDKCADG
jgi:hypothetical protein